MGAEIPFLRPKHLASDNSKIANTIIHTIQYFKKKKIFFDYILLLEPTSPLTTTEDIDDAIKVLEKSNKNVDALVSVAESVSAHPKFCVNAYNIMIDNNIEKTLKLRASDFVGNKQLFCDMLQQEKLVITEQTSMQRRMIGDLLMFGSTKQALELWSAQPWDYSKSGLYNLFDNAEKLAASNNMTTRDYLQKNSTYVTPERIEWYTYENNWDLMKKKPKEEFSTKHLWGNIPGYPYYGGY